MKKIVGIVAAASLVAGLAFADEPVANLGITDFTGNAQVQWGVDLDSGTTGFKNSEYMKFVINLFDAGSKATTGDNVWGELEMKAGNTGNWSHKLYGYDSNTDYTANAVNQPVGGELSFDITAAKLHFGDFYVGIQNGDTVTGEYKFDGAIRSADNGNAKWIDNVGPSYSQGIVAGFGNNNLGIDVDFRSAQDGSNQYTSDYGFAGEIQLKDSNEWVEGLKVDLGGSMNLTKSRYEAKDSAYYNVAWSDADGDDTSTDDTYYNVSNPSQVIKEAKENKFDTTTLGYSANLSYKFKIDDKNFIKPAVAFTGSNVKKHTEATKTTTTTTKNNLVAGVIFGWGDTADANAGLYYFDTDATKKVTPGVSVVAGIPLAEKVVKNVDGTGSSTTTSKAVQAIIVPSFFTNGELVEGLKAAVYSELALLRSEEKSSGTTDVVKEEGAYDKNQTFALALGAAVAYDIKVDEITVTPQAGFRYVNTAFVENNIPGNYCLSNNVFFTDLGTQKAADSGDRAGKLADGFFNLKAGVNVNGLIDNTDFFAVYQSANLLNGTDYHVDANKLEDGSYKKFYNVKLGTFNVGCKISL